MTLRLTVFIAAALVSGAVLAQTPVGTGNDPAPGAQPADHGGGPSATKGARESDDASSEASPSY
jgi:hypothetical protein